MSFDFAQLMKEHAELLTRSVKEQEIHRKLFKSERNYLNSKMTLSESLEILGMNDENN